MRKAEKPATAKGNFTAVIDSFVSTMFIIGLFCLITIGLPLIVPSLTMQTFIYGLVVLIFGYIIYKKS